jgi:hypothetical protein
MQVSNQVVIYTNGAYLVPMRVKINGAWRWVWVVTAFQDASFKNGMEFNPVEEAGTVAELVVDTTAEVMEAAPSLPIGKNGVACKGNK